MKKLNMDLTNCYGIQHLKHEIDFSDKNVAVIYAPNGTMKSSLAETFRNIRDGVQPRERMYKRISTYSVTDENGNAIDKERIMVIDPFEKKDYDGQGLLMANGELRKRYALIHQSIDDKKEDFYEKVKRGLGYSSRKAFNTREEMLSVWGYGSKEEFDCLGKIVSLVGEADMMCSLKTEEIKYDEMFKNNVIEFVKNGDTAKHLEEYEKKYNEIVDKSPYMQKGIIDYNKYGAICKNLGNNNYFQANNTITLKAKDGSGQKVVSTKEEFDKLISDEKARVLNDAEVKQAFEKINEDLQKNKDMQSFAMFLQMHPDLISEYKDVDTFKKKIWTMVVGENLTDAKDLLADVNKAKEELSKLNDEARKKTTEWSKALEHFKQRFYVPFSIEASNQEDVILRQEMPSFKYIFRDEQHNMVEVSKEDLLEALSTGENRAYYILNMIFQVLVAEKEEKEHLLILDDISDSFDYRNKYAIIEYIKDIAERETASKGKCFNILILTHNFDFYRTISSRLGIKKNAFFAYTDVDEIKFEQGQYFNNVFKIFKSKLNTNGNDNYIIASIPFVRNLIEYTEGTDNDDYLILTSVLHSKKDTNSISLKKIEEIFNAHWFKGRGATFATGRENDKVIDILFAEADKIDDSERMAIENKLILSMALRQKTEAYMIDRIEKDVHDGREKIDNITKDQTAALTTIYRDYIGDSNVDLMETVAMITPENIHINSFMFEPILDMSVKRLYEEYHRALRLA